MLEVKKLTKLYGPLVAAKDVSFELEPGDVFGFIGSNGAGKTTTIRMLATLLDPTSGTATLNGVDIVQNPLQIRRLMGYMPDFFGLYDDVMSWEYLDFFATVYDLPINSRKKIIDEVLELTDLTVKRDAFVQSLSRGMQQRLALARCLLHDPTLLLLDEPASGLDPRARAELKELILELGRMGKIIIVSSHILPELAGFCNKVGIIEKGKMITSGPIEQVVRGGRTSRMLSLALLSSADNAAAWLAQQAQVANVSVREPGLVDLEFLGTTEEQADLIEAIAEAKLRLVSLKETEANLEDLFMRVTTGAVN
jgi:ABC-2 type transport system ATP-binding protein